MSWMDRYYILKGKVTSIDTLSDEVWDRIDSFEDDTGNFRVLSCHGDTIVKLDIDFAKKSSPLIAYHIKGRQHSMKLKKELDNEYVRLFFLVSIIKTLKGLNKKELFIFFKTCFILNNLQAECVKAILDHSRGGLEKIAVICETYAGTLSSKEKVIIIEEVIKRIPYCEYYSYKPTFFCSKCQKSHSNTEKINQLRQHIFQNYQFPVRKGICLQIINDDIVERFVNKRIVSEYRSLKVGIFKKLKRANSLQENDNGISINDPEIENKMLDMIKDIVSNYDDIKPASLKKIINEVFEQDYFPDPKDISVLYSVIVVNNRDKIKKIIDDYATDAFIDMLLSHTLYHICL